MGADTQGGAGTAGQAWRGQEHGREHQVSAICGTGRGMRQHTLRPSVPSAQVQALAGSMRGPRGAREQLQLETRQKGDNSGGWRKNLSFQRGGGEEAVIAYLGDEADSEVSNSE